MARACIVSRALDWYSSSMRAWAFLFATSALLATACGPSSTADAGMDGGQTDAAIRDAAGSDAPVVDAGMGPPWLAGNFRYRVPLTIDLPAPVEDVHYFFPLDTAALIGAGKLRADGADIRITQDDGVTPRNFWIEPPLNEARTRIWFAVSALDVGVHRFYLYYGDPAATSASSGSGTFGLFDDFDTLDTSKWTLAVLGQGSVSVVGGTLRLSATTGAMGTSNMASIILSAPYVFSGPFGIAARLVTAPAGTATRADVVFRSTNTGDYFNNGTWARTSFVAESSSYVGNVSNASGGLGGPAAQMVAGFSPHTLALTRDDASGSIEWLFGNPLTQLGEAQVSWPAADLGSPCLAARSYVDAPAFDYRFDWVFVFRFANIFQTVQLGPEEINPAL
jgi:hypothetical protein